MQFPACSYVNIMDTSIQFPLQVNKSVYVYQLERERKKNQWYFAASTEI